ncbi:hypothetical protein HAX54_035845, partial [Datura stramonium]|nr:hypothetical protein [Datura stramonium]
MSSLDRHSYYEPSTIPSSNPIVNPLLPTYVENQDIDTEVTASNIIPELQSLLMTIGPIIL